MVKFNKHHVADGAIKARVSYSYGEIFVNTNDGQRALRKCITLYAKDYGHALGRIFAAEYVNDTDSQTDYFDQGRVRLFPEHPLFEAAKARCDEWAAHWAAKSAAYDARRAAINAQRYGVAA